MDFCSSFVANHAILRTLYCSKFSAWGRFTTFSRSAKGIKIDFQNRKWNYSSSLSKILCLIMFLIFTKEPKIDYKTGNAIISPTSRPHIKKIPLQDVSHLMFTKEFRRNFQNRIWNYLDRKWNYFPPFPVSDWKTSFTKCFQEVKPMAGFSQPQHFLRPDVFLPILDPSVWVLLHYF